MLLIHINLAFGLAICMLFKNAGFTEIHTSASREIKGNSHSYFGKTSQTVSDIQAIKNIIESIG